MPVAGDRYSRLILVNEAGSMGGHKLWKCLCDCGNEHTARLDKLKAGRVKSCGCLRDELIDAAKKSRACRIEQSETILRSARLAKDELRLSALLKQKGTIDYKTFNMTGSPKRIAKEFREWAFIVAAVLWHGPVNDKITISADITVER